MHHMTISTEDFVTTQKSVVPNNEASKLFFRLYLSVQMMYTLVIFLTYALQFYVCIILTWPYIDRALPSGNHGNLSFFAEYGYRILYILAMCESFFNS